VFDCDADAYTVRDSPAKLFRINQDVMPFVFDKIADMEGAFGPDGSLIPIQVNNIGFAPPARI